MLTTARWLFLVFFFFCPFSLPLEHRQSVGLDPPHNRAEGGAEQLVLLLRWSRGGADGGGGGLGTLPRVNRGRCCEGRVCPDDVEFPLKNSGLGISLSVEKDVKSENSPVVGGKRQKKKR